MKIRLISIFLLLMSIACPLQSTTFRLQSEKVITIACEGSEESIVHTALELLSRDFANVFSASPQIDRQNGDIIVGTLGKSDLVEKAGVDVSALQGKKQAFLLAVSPKGKLIVAGSDAHGTAYGILEISRLIGVSPWEWWADATPNKKQSFELPANYRTMQAPTVEYRGIFINDEDWGLMPWSNQTYEPSDIKGHIGPRTNERIFELLLRLRANAYWPAMHECSLPFFLTEGNRQVAKKYGIFIGSSHCEPMACNAAGEWKRRGEGEYDYVNNSRSVYRFWEDRIKEIAKQNNLYTLGMRGVHDGKMQGASTIEEQKAVLERVIEDQRELLKQYVDPDITRIPQVFIPYKEVLDIYRAGLQVPDEVTLMWCDDNYGYITHFPTTQEKVRKGGNGVYYHASYWGRPHDYLWLSSTSPALVYQQMNQAYDKGIQKMWILNVGDIKPGEYLIELFMDMAWDLEGVKKHGVAAHQRRFLEREFGKEAGEKLVPVLSEYYRLAYICKPEYLGNTRVEEKAPIYQVVKDLDWSESYIRERLDNYKKIADEAETIARQIPVNRQDTYFQLVKYPIQAAAQMNVKLLKAQLARHGKADWSESELAFDSITALTRLYNTEKWNRIMDFQPRKLPVFQRVKHEMLSAPMVVDRPVIYKWNGIDGISGQQVACESLGYEGKAASLEKGKSIFFDFEHRSTDSLVVEIRLLPNHPISKNLRIEVSLNRACAQQLSYQTQGRSEEWKKNVLRNQAIRRITFPVMEKGKQQLMIKAMDEGVVVDQVILYAPEGGSPY